MTEHSWQLETMRETLVQMDTTAHENEELDSVKWVNSSLNGEISTLKATVASGELIEAVVERRKTLAKHENTSKHIQGLWKQLDPSVLSELRSPLFDISSNII